MYGISSPKTGTSENFATSPNDLNYDLTLLLFLQLKCRAGKCHHVINSKWSISVLLKWWLAEQSGFVMNYLCCQKWRVESSTSPSPSNRHFWEIMETMDLHMLWTMNVRTKCQLLQRAELTDFPLLAKS